MAGATEQQASALADAQKLIGTVFAEKYEIEAVLGAGGMGVVYKARHTHLNRSVAIKMLLPSVLVNEYRWKRFRQEAQAASSLSHPNIVAAWDFGTAGGSQVYMVMDYVEGRSLQEEIDHAGKLPPDRLIKIFSQVCDGLEHAHKHAVIHRDIKDSNIMLVDTADATDIVKIVDFGLAKTMSEEENPEQRLTESGAVVGSPLFMSPEQCRGIKCDGRSDIYSLGCVMYKCMTGKVPFAGPTPLDTMYMHLNDLPASMPLPMNDSGIQPELFVLLEKVAGRCLFKDANHRYQSMAELKNALSTLHELAAEMQSSSASSVKTLNSPIAAINAPPPESATSLPSATAALPVVRGTTNQQQLLATSSRAMTSGRFVSDNSVKLERQRRELAATGSALVLVMLVATVILVLAASSAQRQSHSSRPAVPDGLALPRAGTEGASGPSAKDLADAARAAIAVDSTPSEANDNESNPAEATIPGTAAPTAPAQPASSEAAATVAAPAAATAQSEQPASEPAHTEAH